MAAKAFVRPAAAFAVAVLTTAIAGSVVQTQINIAAIEGLGPTVRVALRLATTGEDVARFGPVMAAIAAGALLPALAAAMLMARALPDFRALIHAAAGASGLLAAFWLMGFFTPMPTLVAATRGGAGLAAMCATGMIGGLAFAALSKKTAG